MGSHLTYAERCEIKARVVAGQTQQKIARKMKIDQSTISRELKRNKGRRGYRPKQAERKAQQRWASASKAIKLTPKLGKWISAKLRKDWSPEQISGRLNREGLQGVSYERIYQFVGDDKRSGGDLWTHLRWASKKRRKRYGIRDRRGQIPHRRSIEKRGRKANLRKKIGHLERDLVLGARQQGALLTVVDRKSRMTFAVRVMSKSANEIHQATLQVLRPIRKIVRSVTNDNGKEFAKHRRTEKRLQAKIYFTHPYSSYERGSNENTNGLLRQYFPKRSTDFTRVSQRQVRVALNRLNRRPRKCLGFRTPIEVLRKNLSKSKNYAFVT
jgi:IS30 family transposase